MAAVKYKGPSLNRTGLWNANIDELTMQEYSHRSKLVHMHFRRSFPDDGDAWGTKRE